MRIFLMTLLLGSSLAFLAAPLLAQRAPGAIGIGAQAGQPGGFTAKTYVPGLWAGVLSLDTNFRDQTVFHGHLLRERPLPEAPLWWFIGPSAFAGLRDLDARSRVVTGLGARVGLNFYTERIEIYLHASPRIEALPSLQPVLGGSVGLRYYIRF
ncbi:MAG: hypothetical protein PPP56_04435 [Longimonas sp.]|uniref:RNA polymerase subunit sigma-54 n=1 Tax=Longimonas sp. TaxID=2039626 RepID=UPI003356C299